MASCIPYQLRVRFAVREAHDMIERFDRAEEADRSFDAGEWSDAHRDDGDFEAKLQLMSIALCIKHHVLGEDVDAESMRQQWGDDPMRTWHGENV